MDLCRREVIENGFNFVVPDSNGAELVREIKPMNSPRLNGDILLSGQIQSLGILIGLCISQGGGAFYQTRLEEFLAERGIDTLIFAGCNFPNCPRTSITLKSRGISKACHEKGIVTTTSSSRASLAF